MRNKIKHIIKEKRGAEKYLSLYWFFILMLIALGVFIMTYNYYGAPYDIRKVESEILANKIADCISNQGRINPDFFIEKNLNSAISDTFLEKCKINLDVEEGYPEDSLPPYFFEVEFYRIEDVSKSALTIFEGNLNLKADCLINEENNKNFRVLSKCTERRFYAVDDSSNQYLIKILSSVKKNEKNIKI
ncbi:MAG TPA: hypothetical protein PK357_00140 [Candidatus Pacearchaeota archaeon]|nr:hypothetical protein [Candidatus Pacearchaeota archaeon]